MKVVLINKSDVTGGAAIACNRIAQALAENGIQVKLLVQEQKSDQKHVASTSSSKWKRILSFLNFVFERLFFAFYERSKDIRFAFSPANFGEDISQHPYIQTADIIHLHWFNQGFLSLRTLEKLMQTNKPIVWTMHDMWAFSGGCHYSGDCTKFIDSCGNCPYLKRPNENDISKKVFLKKKALYSNFSSIHFVGCSNWIASLAKSSSLLCKSKVTSIPNPIDTEKFKNHDKKSARKQFNIPEDKKVVLFGAANINDKRKGLKYLIEALHILNNEHPEKSANIVFVVFGRMKVDFTNSFPCALISLGTVTQNDLPNIYSAADVFVLPSLEDNLPNTVMEALACSTPVVAFNTGGLPEMIIHKQTGYIAQMESSEDIASGILSCLEPENEIWSNNAREFVLKNYSRDVIAMKYISLYNNILKNN